MAYLSKANEFYKVGAVAISAAQVTHIDFGEIGQLSASVHLVTGEVLVAQNIDALELAMRVKPSVLESRRLRWPKWAWLVHNLLGHPLMQILAIFRCYKAAFWIHDATVPRPSGKK